MSKNFLIPVAAAVAALTAGNQADARKIIETHASAVKPNPTPAAPKSETSQMIYPEGSALHSLVLTRGEQGAILAQHESHYSHSSHASHASHSSHYSGN